MRRRRHGRTLALGLVSAGFVLAACDTNDGRDMEPPSSYEQWVLQNTTPSTSTTTTTLPPETLPPTSPLVVDTIAPSVASDASDAASVAPSASDDTAGGSQAADQFAASLGLTDLAADVELVGPWPDGGEIPVEYTCTGDENAPLITWTAPPEGSVELALVVVDETADDFAHWIVIGLPPEAGSVGGPEPVVVGTEATNSSGAVGWAGPCPPDDAPHTYRVTLFALDATIDPPADSGPAELIQAIEDSATGAVSFTGTYQVA